MPAAGAPTPPWENIDNVPKRDLAETRNSFDLTGFISGVTGFSRLWSKLFLLGLAVIIFFLAYVYYEAAQQGAPPPPYLNRPAIDKYASSTTRI